MSFLPRTLRAASRPQLFRPIKLSPAPIRIPLQRRFYQDEFKQRLLHDARTGGQKRHWFPILTATLLVGTAIGGAGYYIYLYNELVNKPLSVYPSAVAQDLKTALYYASREDAATMTQYFKSAIQKAEDAGLHPLSDEVAGLKIECANLLATLQDGKLKKKGIQVLERIIDESVAGAEFFEKNKRAVDRTLVLKRAVLLGYKVGELYEDLGEDASADEAMSWSTQTLLKEIQRRVEGGVEAEKEGAWFENEEIARCLEKMANHYERTDKHSFAAPLYLRALSLYPEPTCHAATLMANLAVCLSQQLPPPNSKVKREDLINDGTKWAQKALQVAGGITPPARTEECDQCTVVATQNLGEMAEMLGRKEEAFKKYREARSLAKVVNMEEGMRLAEEGLKRNGNAESAKEREGVV